MDMEEVTIAAVGAIAGWFLKEIRGLRGTTFGKPQCALSPA